VTRFLERYVRPNLRVLEGGCGLGCEDTGRPILVDPIAASSVRAFLRPHGRLTRSLLYSRTSLLTSAHMQIVSALKRHSFEAGRDGKVSHLLV
jgi:hypothetical protein